MQVHKLITVKAMLSLRLMETRVVMLARSSREGKAMQGLMRIPKHKVSLIWLANLKLVHEVPIRAHSSKMTVT